MPFSLEHDIEKIIALAHSAGKQVMKIYASDFNVDYKQDESPVTTADLIAHSVICSGLELLDPNIPILSEESSPGPEHERLCWSTYWLIDPLDGTKEFIDRNGEFTVNIALIDRGVPVLGVVYAPALDVCYWGSEKGAFKCIEKGEAQLIEVAATPLKSESWKVVASRRHQNEATRNSLSQFGATEIVSMGSSLKFCLIAEGSADFYPRLAPTSEWDTAAAQAIVEAAGGCVLEYPSLQPLRYNRRADTLLNPHFIVCAESPLYWV